MRFFNLALQEREQWPIKFVAVPVLEFGSGSFGVDHSKRSTETPERPAGFKFADCVQRIVEPRENDLRRSVLVTTHLAKMNRNARRIDSPPRLKLFSPAGCQSTYSRFLRMSG